MSGLNPKSSASKCRNCLRLVVWQDKVPFDARLINEVYIADKPHWKTCPHLEKLRQQKNCPACLIVKDGLQTIVDIKLTNDLCKAHEEVGKLSVYYHGMQRTIDLDYKSLSATRRDVKEQIAKLGEVRKQIADSDGGLTKFF